MECDQQIVVKGGDSFLTPAPWSRIFSPLLDLLFPPLCHSCHTFIPDAGEVKLCATCMAGIAPLAAPLCTCCGRPFATEGGVDHRCGRCTTDPPAFSAARSAFRFDSTARDLIHGFKYGCKVQLRRPLGLLAAPHLDGFVTGFAPDLILPVPLHVRRLRQRGFNQAILLAEVFSTRWGIPVSRNNLRRTRWTEPQVSLSAAERADNVKGAFSLARPAELADRRVLLVDDVYTTGSTVKECSRVLLHEGGATTAVVTLARGVD